MRERPAGLSRRSTAEHAPPPEGPAGLFAAVVHWVFQVASLGPLRWDRNQCTPRSLVPGSESMHSSVTCAGIGIHAANARGEEDPEAGGGPCRASASPRLRPSDTFRRASDARPEAGGRDSSRAANRRDFAANRRDSLRERPAVEGAP